ncbi:WD40 repeat-like protein [Sistotremastrum suecicum HHB10207 ss-3]|uniref:WD40 repeat-like protein n=1 Tax=Sistotremastrum suecicum HHB10207 ss-3 TaxID=1314776 RepID=A0A166FWE8_9AGAM|nr:WD40 repeat-like protein [Sistotremastrum suecicum HHB10207 ss-3]
MASSRRVSYVIPTPTVPVPLLSLPSLHIPRDGRPGPLVIPSSPKKSIQFPAQAQPQHRLGVASLALDTSTLLEGHESPEGILYSGGRDGLVIAWDLHMSFSRRKCKYGYEPGVSPRAANWEYLTGWADDIIDEEDDPDDLGASDGDVLGEVLPRKRRSKHSDQEIPYEDLWELNTSDSSEPPPSTFRQCAQAHSDWVSDLVLCNQNQTVVSASSDGTVKAWSPHDPNPTSQNLALVGTHSDYVRCLAHTPHQPWVASGSLDRTIKLWDISRATSSHPHTTSSSSSSLGSSSNAHNGSLGKPPAPVVTLQSADPSSPKSSVYTIALTDEYGGLIASGGPERVVRLWDPRSGKRAGKLVGHTDIIRSIVGSGTGQYLLTGSADSSIKLWSLSSPYKCLHTFSHHTDSIWALHSSHPRLETFYSGDRSGNLCRIDVESSDTLNDAECTLLCRDQSGEGIGKILARDDKWVWTATGQSSITRWRDVGRKEGRLDSGDPFGDEFGSPAASRRNSTTPAPPGYSTTSITTSSVVSNSVSGSPASPRSIPTLEPRRSSASFTSHATATTTTTANANAFASRGADGSGAGSGLNGIPYDSLVKLEDQRDYAMAPVFAGTGGLGGPGANEQIREADVATLYSAASIQSVPRLIPNRHNTLSPPNAVAISPNNLYNPSSTPPSRAGAGPGSSHISPHLGISPPHSGSQILYSSGYEYSVQDGIHYVIPPSARQRYEHRDLVENATPLRLQPEPNSVIQGGKGFLRSVILNSRMHALSVDAGGEVALWDIVRAICLGVFSNEDVERAVLEDSGEMNKPKRDAVQDFINGTLKVKEEKRVIGPREALEAVRERVEGEGNVLAWARVDTGVGNLTVQVLERCFEGEIFGDEAGYDIHERRFDDEFRLNIGKWVLTNLFSNFIREELKLSRLRSGAGGSEIISRTSTSRSLSGRIGDQNHLYSLHMTPGLQSPAISSVITTPSMTPAVLPESPSLLRRDNVLSPIPQSPGPIPPPTDGLLTPRPTAPRINTSDTIHTLTAQAGGTNTATNTPHPNHHHVADYFSHKGGKKAPLSPTTPDDFSGWGGAAPSTGAKEAAAAVAAKEVPSTPTGFMGRLKVPWKTKGQKTPGVDTAGAAAASGGNTTLDEIDEKSDVAEEKKISPEQKIILGSLSPPTQHDAPPLAMPPNAVIVISDESSSGTTSFYRGLVSSTGDDAQLLEEVMPLWLLECLLLNKTPPPPVVKLGFVLLPWKGEKTELLLPDLSTSQSRLTASRFLRIRKVAAYVQEKIEEQELLTAQQQSVTSGDRGTTNNDAQDATNPSSSASTTSTNEDTQSDSASGTPPTPTRNESQRQLSKYPEESFEILCNDAVLPWYMTLAAVRQFIWRQGAELVMHYRRKTPVGSS